MNSTSDTNNPDYLKKLSPERAKIISYLEDCLGYAAEGYPLSKSESSTWTRRLQTQIDKTKYGCYYVTLLGGFGSGKSTLINAMIGYNLLPVSTAPTTAPTTAVQTEIYEGEKVLFFIPMGKVESELLSLIESDIRKLVSPCSFQVITELQRGNNVYTGIGAEFPDNDIEEMAKIIAEIFVPKKRSSGILSKLKDYLSATPDAQILLSLNNWPTWLKDIVLTDVPGAGSVHSYYEKIINQVIPHSQLILYILEANKIGAALDMDFSNRISNIHKRKIFYIVNKSDMMNEDQLYEALEDARVQVPDTAVNGVKPEFLPASALCAMEALMMESGKLTYRGITAVKQVNIRAAIQDPKWSAYSEEERNQFVSRYLHKRSLFSQLKGRIEQYLRYENKDLALAETTVNLIQSFASDYQRDCEDMTQILQKHYDVSQLQKEQDDKIALRNKYKGQAETIIDDFKNNLNSRTSPLYRDFPDMFKEMGNEIIKHIDAQANKPSNLSKLLDNNYANLNELIQGHYTNWVTKFDEEKNNKLTEEVKSLDKKLKPIFKDIIDKKLSISKYGNINADGAEIDQTTVSAAEVVGGAAIAAAATSGALAAAGIGVVRQIWFLGRKIKEIFGMKPEVFVVVAVGVAITGISLLLIGRRNKFKKNKSKLLEHVNGEILPKIEEQIRKETHEQALAQIEKTAKTYTDALNQLLTEMEQDETNLIKQISAQEEERDCKIAEWKDKTSRLLAVAEKARKDLL